MNTSEVRAFPRLLSPLTIGSVTIKNRIVSSGHDTVMADNGLIGPRLIAYHQARARGGAGLIVVQVAGVHESARYTPDTLMATDDTCISGYRALARALAPYGTTLFGQLFHPGREVHPTSDPAVPPPVAPSAIANERFNVVPRALLTSEVHDIVAGYASAARRLMIAGLVGVEIVASHGYLPSQFLNPLTNIRDDAYGGSAQNRARFLEEVLVAVRRYTSPQFVVGLRISLDEHDPAGLDEALAVSTIIDLDRAGLIDYVSVTTGTSATLAGSAHIAPDMSHPNGYVAPSSKALRSQIKVPVILAGRINQPQEAERLLEAGSADALVMTRALICDPDLPLRVYANTPEDIRACVGCNQACIGHFQAGLPISCIQHPETGRELEFPLTIRTSSPKRILVVGAGPAGLKAASVLASRGHDVTIHERGPVLGGQVLLAQLLPGREEFGGVATNLARELKRSGATVVLNSTVTKDVVTAGAFDAVVIATGAVPYTPSFEVMGAPSVINADDVLRGRAVAPGKVVIVDYRGDYVAPGVAQLLRSKNNEVTVATPNYSVGESLQQYVHDTANQGLIAAGATTLPLVRFYGVHDDEVYFQHVLTGDLVTLTGIATVVLATNYQPENALANDLAATPVPVTLIGDALSPRTVEEAVLEGLVEGSEL